jgi:hypothetical protein
MRDRDVRGSRAAGTTMLVMRVGFIPLGRGFYKEVGVF